MDVTDKLRTFCRVLKRKKVYDSIEDVNSGNLKRCLNKWDLSALGVGSTLGVGVYVLVGNVARNIAGPSVVLSFLLAALASLFAGLCYAEFGARVPKAGSAYAYSYVCVGEFIAFIIGWNLILEYMIGSASVARGLSLYVDSMVNGSMSQLFQQYAPIGVPWMSPYFDFFAFIIIIIFGLGLSYGMRESSSINNALSAVNICVVLFVILAGAVTANTANWSIPAADIPPEFEAGSGGFFPYGISGTIQGAATCFYGFVGFDCIATTGEEVKDPKKAIPFAIILSLVVIFLGYFGVSTVVTMMVPYYLQDIEAPVPFAFSSVGWEWARWLVAVGATFGLCASLYGAMFPLPRIIYAMASDGLIFRCLGSVTADRRSPVVATLISTVFIGFLGAIFELRHLVAMMSMGTLLAYTIVSACVLLLRYRTDIEIVEREQSTHELTFLVGPGEKPTGRAVCLQLLGIGDRKPSALTSAIVAWCLVLYSSACFAVGLVRLLVDEFLIPVAGLVAFALLLVLVIALQPKSKKQLTFMVPLVPLVPCLSIFSNIYLMLMLDHETWIRFVTWIVIGLPVYFICLCIYDRRPKTESNGHLHGNLNRAFDTPGKNKHSVKIVVQSPTPPTARRPDDTPLNQRPEQIQQVEHVRLVEHTAKQYKAPIAAAHIAQQNDKYDMMLTEIEHDDLDNKLDKETRIIELLDQVLEAEEESYRENANLNNIEDADAESSRDVTPEPDTNATTTVENSDGESVESMSGVTPTYDVVVQVHREDLPKVTEFEDQEYLSEVNEPENERKEYNVIKLSDDNEEQILNEIIEANNVNVDEEIKSINELMESQENSIIELVHLDISSKVHSNGTSEVELTDDEHVQTEIEDKSVIPVPPPMDDNYYKYFDPTLQRSRTLVVIPRKDPNETNKQEVPRERTFSGNSLDDKTIVFGSDRQINFMNKLSNMLQNKPVLPKPSGPKRSISSSHILDLDKLEREENDKTDRLKPMMMFDLKKELMARHSKANADLKSRESDSKMSNLDSVENNEHDEEDGPDHSMSREDLKSKLEHIFAAGGPRMLKPRLVSSNPPTPELQAPGLDSTVEEMLSSASLSPLKEKTDKSDTLKLQRAKFGEVLNSFKTAVANEINTSGDNV